MEKYSRFFQKSGVEKNVKWEIQKNTVASLPCYHCRCEIFKNWKFYRLDFVETVKLKAALCFDCFNKWKRGKIVI